MAAGAGTPGAPGLPEGSARRLLDPEEQAAFAAVGQLRNHSNARHCTATLIAADLVLTAAHCVANSDSNWVAQPYRIVFDARSRNGYSPERRNGAELAIGPGYLASADIGADLALVRLKDPLPGALVQPIPVAEAPMLRGHPLSVYSYGYDAPDALAEEAECRSLAAHGDAMVTSCEAVGGVSGAPVVVQGDDGAPRVAAVVSSRLSSVSRPAPLGRAVVVPVDRDRLADLIARLSPRPGG